MPRKFSLPGPNAPRWQKDGYLQEERERQVRAHEDMRIRRIAQEELSRLKTGNDVGGLRFALDGKPAIPAIIQHYVLMFHSGPLATMLSQAMDSKKPVKINDDQYRIRCCGIDTGTGAHTFWLEAAKITAS